MTPLIYKYEAISAQSLENLKAQAIYFGSPAGFNDPYNCAIFPEILEPNNLEAERVRNYYLSREDLPQQVRHEFETATNQALRELVHRAGKAAVRQAVAKFSEVRGVSCFSEMNDDLLMWSHYGGRYKGY